MNKKSIIYIAGEGHSGSTLLDVILGNNKKTFSAGELSNLSEKGIKNKEYCSCGVPVPECYVWDEIISEWNLKRNLDLESYLNIQKKLLSNRQIISSQIYLKKKSGLNEYFIQDTELLYNIMFKVTKSDFIIDSSKSPGMIPILNKLTIDVRILHLTRRFGDVLNSNKKKRKKNLKAGIEHDVNPRRTSYVLRSWLLNNFLIKIFSKKCCYHRIKYEEYINNLVGTISKVINYEYEYECLLRDRGPFYPRHLVAGNAMRMKDEIYVAKKPLNRSYERLNRRDKVLAKCIDTFY